MLIPHSRLWSQKEAKPTWQHLLAGPLVVGREWELSGVLHKDTNPFLRLHLHHPIMTQSKAILHMNSE